MMGFWKKRTKPIINTELYSTLLNGREINVVDGGSSNMIFEPFDCLRRNAVIYMFEPNQEMGKYTSNLRTVGIDSALWNDNEGVVIHIAAEPTTSSVYPPNKYLLSKFQDHIGYSARKTIKQVRVPSISIDSAVKNQLFPAPDFIKLDVHSSEYEALEGASNALEHCSAVLVETWHSPIHSGQHLHGEIEHYLNKKGLFLFDMHLRSKWNYKNTRNLNAWDRHRLVGSEGIFFREEYKTENIIIALGLLDLFQYTSPALDLLEHNTATKSFKHEMKNEILSLNRRTMYYKVLYNLYHGFDKIKSNYML